jgi:hypothetical protein
MAVKKRRRGASSGETKSEAQLAPPEEKEGAPVSRPNPANDGKLPVNTGELKLPQELVEEETEGPGFQRVDPVVLVILCFSLIFILIIAYVIWSGWEPPR